MTSRRLLIGCSAAAGDAFADVIGVDWSLFPFENCFAVTVCKICWRHYFCSISGIIGLALELLNGNDLYLNDEVLYQCVCNICACI